LKKPPKILFFPNYLGGGFGHTGRCLAMAEAFRARGGQAAFVLSGPHLTTVVRAGFETYTLSTPSVSVSQSHGPAYIYFADMAYQIVRDGFDKPRRVFRALKEAGKLVEEFMPDILVGDGYLLTAVIGNLYDIPVVQFVKSPVHPQPQQMVWWENTPVDMISPDPGPVFNPVLSKMGLPNMTRLEQLLSGDLLILPSIPSLDPMEPLPEKTYYVGAIVEPRITNASLPPWFNTLSYSKPVIYVTVGGAAGHGGSTEFFRLVFEAFRETDWQVILSTGGKTDPNTLGPMPPNMRAVRWVPGTEMIARSDLVVFHGGYTRMQILVQGRPSVVLPFHSEQEYYGRLMEKAGVATLVHLSDKPYQRIITRWRGGGWWKSKRFSIHIRPIITLQPDTLRLAVKRGLSDSMMHSRIQLLKTELETYGGCDQAIDLISQKFLSNMI
jgi:UDP:flavonoid glycosyltransferase YjiC (YdhE family)